MTSVLAALGMSFILPFAFLQDNGNCTGNEARWNLGTAGGQVDYEINTTAQPFASTVSRVQAAMGQFDRIGSSDFEWVYQPGTPPRGFVGGDNTNAISFGDVNGDLGTGVLAATISYRGGATHTHKAQTFRTITEMDIVFNNGLTFAPNADVADSGCSNQFSLEAVLIHEAGHGAGLQHPDQCVSPNDPEGAFEPYAGAIMYSAIAPCDQSKLGFKSDDVEGLTYIYDNGGTLAFPSARAAVYRGYAPLIVQFFNNSVGATTNNWTFGDGQSSTASQPSHTYQNAGTYTVNLTINGSLPALPIQITAVQAPAVDFSGDVTSGEAPVTVQFTNLTQGTTFGNPTWEFGDGIVSSEANPSHEYQVPGTYTVMLTVTGEEGPVSETKTSYITVDEPTGGGNGDEKKGPFADFFESLGCSCAMSGPSGVPSSSIWLALAALMGVVILRRRRVR